MNENQVRTVGMLADEFKELLGEDSGVPGVAYLRRTINYYLMGEGDMSTDVDWGKCMKVVNGSEYPTSGEIWRYIIFPLHAENTHGYFNWPAGNFPKFIPFISDAADYVAEGEAPATYFPLAKHYETFPSDFVFVKPTNNLIKNTFNFKNNGSNQVEVTLWMKDTANELYFPDFFRVESGKTNAFGSTSIAQRVNLVLDDTISTALTSVQLYYKVKINGYVDARYDVRGDIQLNGQSYNPILYSGGTQTGVLNSPEFVVKSQTFTNTDPSFFQVYSASIMYSGLTAADLAYTLDFSGKTLYLGTGIVANTSGGFEVHPDMDAATRPIYFYESGSLNATKMSNVTGTTESYKLYSPDLTTGTTYYLAVPFLYSSGTSTNLKFYGFFRTFLDSTGEFTVPSGYVGYDIEIMLTQPVGNGTIVKVDSTYNSGGYSMQWESGMPNVKQTCGMTPGTFTGFTWSADGGPLLTNKMSLYSNVSKTYTVTGGSYNIGYATTTLAVTNYVNGSYKSNYQSIVGTGSTDIRKAIETLNETMFLITIA